MDFLSARPPSSVNLRGDSLVKDGFGGGQVCGHITCPSAGGQTIALWMIGSYKGVSDAQPCSQDGLHDISEFGVTVGSDGFQQINPT